MSDLAARTHAALDGLKEAFYALDTQQRNVRMHVEAYSLHLPTRIEKSGLVPRFKVLDNESEGLFREYLDTLDRFPLLPRARPEALSVARNAFLHLRERIDRQVGVLVQFVSDYDAEFRRVGQEIERFEQHKRDSAAALTEATRLWQEFRAQGYESADADRALARARVASRAVQGWTIQAGATSLEEAARLVASLCLEVGAVTADFPVQVRRARARRLTLRTRLEAIDTRSESVADDVRALRREFSAPNFRDLEQTEEAFLNRRAKLNPLLDAFDRAIRQGDWDETLSALTRVETALEELDGMVGAPRARLQVLRSFKSDPQGVMGQAQFALRDAQQMVVRMPRLEQQAFGNQLDRLSTRLGALPRLLDSVHPDYLHTLDQLNEIRRSVKDVVEAVRQQRSGR